MVVARGLVNYDSDELPALLGRSTRDLAAELGAGYDRTVVHRDALVVLDDEGAVAVELQLVDPVVAFGEVIDELGNAPEVHVIPVGNAGNISAYWRGYTQYASAGKAVRTPRMWGFQAAGAAPLVLGHPVLHPETVATAIRIGNPASTEQARAARDESRGLIEAVSDQQILDAQGFLAREEGIFVEPASAAGVAGLLAKHQRGEIESGLQIVITVTGHGLKDPQWAVRNADGTDVTPIVVSKDTAEVASALGLSKTPA